MANQTLQPNEFSRALDALRAEHGLPPELWLRAVEDALATAYRRETNPPHPIVVRVDPENGQQRLYAVKQVVARVRDEGREISLASARQSFPEAAERDEVEVQLPLPESWGRIAGLAFKQIVQQKLRDAAESHTFDRFADLEGELVSGVVTRVEEGTVFVSLGGAEGELPPAEQVAGESYRPGQRLRAYLARVQRGLRGTKLLLSRADRGLLRRLLELEVPEIHAGVVELKAIAREPGSRTKVAVSARQQGVDPVGACVGVRGVRIQNVVNELNGEKIDVVQWDESPARFVANALSPAQATDVQVIEGERRALVTVPDNQLSLAIGKEGQNARLAAKLTGWRVDIRKQSDVPAPPAPEPPPREPEPEPEPEESEPVSMAELLDQIPVEARDEG